MIKTNFRIKEEIEHNPILETTKFVVDHAKYVKINKNKLIEFCKHFDHKDKENIRHWLNDAPFNINILDEKDRLNFLLIFNSISFSYWGNPKWTIEYNGKKFDGAWGMIAALKRGIDEGKLILNADFLARITEKELEYILRGNIRIPLLKERWQILRQVGTILKEKYAGDFSKLVSEAQGNSIKLLNLIIDTFPSFRDISTYSGRKILFYKRAQLLVADIYQGFKGKGYGNLRNISQITACADYKLPQVLRRYGILSYSKDLNKKIENKIEIPHGSTEEIEIRSSTIWVVKYLERLLEPKIPYIDSIHVNDHLWLLGQFKDPIDKPYHRTRTIAY